jgi:hypothetical protein
MIKGYKIIADIYTGSYSVYEGGNVDNGPVQPFGGFSSKAEAKEWMARNREELIARLDR